MSKCELRPVNPFRGSTRSIIKLEKTLACIVKAIVSNSKAAQELKNHKKKT